MPVDPRTYVSLQPIPYPSHVGLQVTARSSKPVYTCEYPTRKQVAKDNYSRREYQKSHCGYQSANYKPYKSVGNVVLDEKELILRALGQVKDNKPQDSNEEEPKGDNFHSISVLDTPVQADVKKSKDIVHQCAKETSLQSVQSQVNNGRKVINKVKLGFELFKIIKEEQRKKAVRMEEERKQEEEKKSSMTVVAAYDSSDEESEVDLSKYLVPLPDRDEFSLSSSEDEDDRNSGRSSSNSIASVASQLMTKSRSSSINSVKSFLNVSRWHRAGSMIALDRDEKTKASPNQSRSRDSSARQRDCLSPSLSPRLILETSGKGKERLSSRRASSQKQFLSPGNGEGDLKQSRRSSRVSGMKSMSLQSVQRANAKKFKKSLPRPFSPIHTNINFYETLSKEHTFRQLCVVNWILESMSQDQQPAVMPAISTCWNLKELREDIKVMKKKVERDKAVDPMWKSFLMNPNRFSQGRAGRRSTLYQRRVSVAPSALLKFSGSRSNSIVPAVQAVFKAETPSDSETDKMTKERVLSPSVTDKDSDAENRILTRTPSVSFQVQPESRISSAKAAESSRLNSPRFRDKAYIVRDVLVAKPDSRPKSKGGPTPLRSRSRTASTISEPDTDDDAQQDYLRKRGLAKDSMNWKSKFAAAAIATFGAISANSKASDLTEDQKRKFQEVKEEQALVVHDNLEVIERNRLQSIEKKYCSLHVVTDVFKAIEVMRKQGKLKIETEEEKKARYSVECIWYKNLLDNLPEHIRDDADCAIALDKIARFGSLEGRKISPAHFLRALTSLRSWELCDPDISAAIEYVRDKIVGMDKMEFDDWFKKKSSSHERSVSAPP